jgi:aquaporin Z
MRSHWPEYAIEALGIATFMAIAVTCTVLLEHPASALRAALPDAFARRVLMGLAMGATAMALVYSPWGKRSGAHFNPALTLTFLRLGKIAPADALGYVLAQFAGAIGGVALAGAALAPLPADPPVRFAVTLPGMAGAGVAFAAEVAISFGLMATVLAVSNAPRVARWTGVCCGLLVAAYIALEAPLSGMSMNPARTFGSAAGARVFDALWIYFAAPLAGMLLAAELYVRGGAPRVRCAKLHHQNAQRCIFRCGWSS